MTRALPPCRALVYRIEGTRAGNRHPRHGYAPRRTSVAVTVDARALTDDEAERLAWAIGRRMGAKLTDLRLYGPRRERHDELRTRYTPTTPADWQAAGVQPPQD